MFLFMSHNAKDSLLIQTLQSVDQDSGFRKRTGPTMNIISIQPMWSYELLLVTTNRSICGCWQIAKSSICSDPFLFGSELGCLPTAHKEAATAINRYIYRSA